MNIQSIANFYANYNKNTNIWSYVLYTHLHKMKRNSSFASFCIHALDVEDWDIEAAKEYTWNYYKSTYGKHQNDDYEHFDEAISAYIQAIKQVRANPSDAESIITEVLYTYFRD